MKKIIYLCRHSKTYENSIEKRFGRSHKKYPAFEKEFGKDDEGNDDDEGELFGLTPNGKKLAKQLNPYFKKELGEEPYSLFLTNFRRTEETAKIFLEGFKNLESTKKIGILNETEILQYRIEESWELPEDLETRLIKNGVTDIDITNLKKLIETKNMKNITEFFNTFQKSNEYVRDRNLSYLSTQRIQIIKALIADSKTENNIFVGHAYTTATILDGLGIEKLKNHFKVNCWAYKISISDNEFKLIDTFEPEI